MPGKLGDGIHRRERISTMKRELAALISLTVLATIAAARADDGGAYKVVL